MVDDPIVFDADGYLAESPIRPVVALHLWFAASALAERADRSVMSVAGGLPPIAKLWVDHPAWADRLAGCYRMVRDRLAVAAFPVARCTGEEFALHMAISAAAQLAAEGLGPDTVDYGMQVMPDPDAGDFVVAHEDLFADDDLMMLFEPVLDGIEDPGTEANQRRGIGPYLHPSRWFDPFPGYDKGAPLERLRLQEPEPDDVIVAALNLAITTGARGTAELVQDHDRWVARARYPGREIVGQGEDPHAAATDLAREILEGAHCGTCNRTVTVDPGGPLTSCLWARHGDRWQAGCVE